MKSAQIRSYFWSVFSRIRTEYGPEKTPYLDKFHTALIAEAGQYEFLGKIATHFTHFHLLTSPSQMKIFIYSTYLFLLQLPPCLTILILINHISSWKITSPPHLILINHISSWKSKIKHMGVDITYFFSRCKNFTNKT